MAAAVIVAYEYPYPYVAFKQGLQLGDFLLVKGLILPFQPFQLHFFVVFADAEGSEEPHQFNGGMVKLLGISILFHPALCRDNALIAFAVAAMDDGQRVRMIVHAVEECRHPLFCCIGYYEDGTRAVVSVAVGMLAQLYESLVMSWQSLHVQTLQYHRAAGEMQRSVVWHFADAAALGTPVYLLILKYMCGQHHAVAFHGGQFALCLSLAVVLY